MIQVKQVIEREDVTLPRALPVAVHCPMSERHRAALAAVARDYRARTDPHAEVDGIEGNITLDDGDLVWHYGGGCDLMFSVVHVPAGVFVRAMEKTSDRWTTVATWPIDLGDHTGTARTIWLLITLIVA
ncbi:hypothetical protein [Rhodococcus sp. NPDC058481]|uniref:hypothetical protein n=1 Tax=unclassified Rhodococcus (in: high G+C Gram-positive bacteria) TaxID=192944 RepID=UPI003660D67C